MNSPVVREASAKKGSSSMQLDVEVVDADARRRRAKMADRDRDPVLRVRRDRGDDSTARAVEVQPQIPGPGRARQRLPPREQWIDVQRVARRAARSPGRRAHLELVRQPVGRRAALEGDPAPRADEAREAGGRLRAQLAAARREVEGVAARRAVAKRPQGLDGGLLGMMDAGLRDRMRPQRSYTISTSAIAIRSPACKGLCWMTWPFTRVPLRERKSEISTRPPRVTISAW